MNTYFFDSTGKCTCAANTEVSAEDGQIVVHSEETYAPKDVYYDFAEGMMLLTKQFDVTITTNTVSNVPIGTTVFQGSDSAICDDGAIELAVQYPSTVTLVLMHPAYVDKIVEVPCEA